jgi:hypothetical protein
MKHIKLFENFNEKSIIDEWSDILFYRILTDFLDMDYTVTDKNDDQRGDIHYIINSSKDNIMVKFIIEFEKFDNISSLIENKINEFIKIIQDEYGFQKMTLHERLQYNPLDYSKLKVFLIEIPKNN